VTAAAALREKVNRMQNSSCRTCIQTFAEKCTSMTSSFWQEKPRSEFCLVVKIFSFFGRKRKKERKRERKNERKKERKKERKQKQKKFLVKFPRRKKAAAKNP
jgi:hypothetical protein